jgi:hypothetical protein
MFMTIPTGDAAVVFLADALCKERELSEVESRVLQRALTRETGAFRRWTPAEDAKLLKMHRARIHAGNLPRAGDAKHFHGDALAGR